MIWRKIKSKSTILGWSPNPEKVTPICSQPQRYFLRAHCQLPSNWWFGLVWKRAGSFHVQATNPNHQLRLTDVYRTTPTKNVNPNHQLRFTDVHRTTPTKHTHMCPTSKSKGIFRDPIERNPQPNFEVQPADALGHGTLLLGACPIARHRGSS